MKKSLPFCVKVRSGSSSKSVCKDKWKLLQIKKGKKYFEVIVQKDLNEAQVFSWALAE